VSGRENVCLTTVLTRAVRWQHVGTRTAPATDPMPAQQPQRWHLMSGVCLERVPVITAEMNSIESEFSNLLATLELENSVLSDHELRHLEDLKIAEKKKQDVIDEADTDATKMTAIEIEDAWEEELKSFTKASRRTEADARSDVLSLERALDRRLVLVVRQKLGDKDHWLLPMDRWNDGESMRQTAERVLASLCGTELQAIFLGNAPCGFYKYRYPSAVQSSAGVAGAKVFFFKAQYCSGQVVLPSNKTIQDYMWLSRDELKQHLMPIYRDKVKKFIMDL